jgi:hypothetical protein
VERAAALDQECRKRHLMRKRVFEHVRELGEVGLLVNELQSLELAERAVEPRLDVRDAVEQPYRELAPDNGSELDRLPRLDFESIDATEDHFLDRVWHEHLVDRLIEDVRPVASPQHAGLNKRFCHLFDEEWVALCLADDKLRERAR